jgi:uncharacterized Fe-S cluster-containing radical SAM superfamily protein
MIKLYEYKPKIKYVNIDPNGICNAKCWFCPVAYVGNSKENKTNMSIETMENIFKQLDEGRGDFVVPGTIFNSPIHFNEMLLYPYFEEMLELHKKYNIAMIVFTNGVNLTKEKTDLIKKYKDVVKEIRLNVPSANAEEWSRFTGFNIKIFPKLLDNLKYAEQELSTIYDSKTFYIMVNGVNEKSLFKNGGWTEILENAPEYNLNLTDGTMAKTIEEFKNIFPNIHVWGGNNLSDRTSILEDLKIISNQPSIKAKNQGKVIGCGTSYNQGFYVSATGNVFICCIDFEYETVYANIHNASIKEIWEGSQRQEAIQKAYSGLCVECLHSVKEKGSGPSLQKTI